jgi:hypothetical protein
MGRKKRVVVLEEPADDEVELSDVQAEIKDEKEIAKQKMTDEWLSDFQERFSDQPVKVLVEKYDEKGDWGMCRKYLLSVFDPEIVRDEFGGGRYRAMLVQPTGKYIKESRNYFTFTEPLFKGAKPEKENPLENPVVIMMLENAKSQQAALMNLTQSMIQAQTAAAPKGGGLVELIEAMKSLKTMTPQDRPMDNFKETLGMMKLVKEVTGDGDGDGKGGLLSDLKDVLEVLPQLKEHMAALKPAVANAAPPSLAGPGMMPQPTTITTEGRPAMDPLTKKVVDLVPQFVAAGKAAANVNDWGIKLLDAFDVEIVPLLLPVMRQKYKALVKDEDDVYDIVLRLAQDPDERDMIFKQIPPLAPYKDWALRVIDEAVRLAQEPTPEEDAPAGGGSAILEAVAQNGHEEQ